MAIIMKEELKDLIETFSPKEKEEISNYLINIHKYGLEHSHASPAHFFALAQTYHKIYDKKVNSRGSQVNTIQ